MSAQQEVQAVALKLPIIWTLQPRVWFDQAEAQFQIRQITRDDTKYYNVVSALNQSTAAQVEDFIQAPPEEEKYDKFKILLLETFGLSRREQASRLLHLDGLGDRPPSVLMNKMLALADGHKPCLMFKQAFLEQLPDDIHLLLADADFSDPRKVAARADVLWRAKKESGSEGGSWCAVASLIAVGRHNAELGSGIYQETTARTPVQHVQEAICVASHRSHQRWLALVFPETCMVAGTCGRLCPTAGGRNTISRSVSQTW
ncbi:uncharacterized protein LOC127585295 [Pristis pectinata]|uniref:uncharacterized protein LOC127585295 n=1 Tax=Pristis pectinata TaxID=685728 RepID=UPI00223D68BD|nr:uncharacterized protein LOC127585295 [Pristis pectinata]